MYHSRAHQARQTHRKRKAYGRALHQVLALRRPWMAAWKLRIKVPYIIKHRKVDLYRAFRGA